MLHWLETAVSVYLLHPLHGNGYQFWSGIGGRTFGTATLIGFFAAHLHWHHGRRR